MSTAIVEVQTAVAEFDRVAAGIAELQKRYGGTVYDVAIADGMKSAKEARAAIREPRYEIERVRKDAKAPILKLGKELDTRAKQITDELLAIENPIDLQIKNEEARKEREKQAKADAELARVTKHQERIVYLNGSPNLSSLDDPALIAEHISDLESEIVDESMEEYRERADAAKATGIARLQALHAASVARVAEAARVKADREELALLREQQAEQNRKAQADRDAEAAKQAAELKAAREKQEAEAAAERKRIADEAAAAKAVRDAEAAELKATQEKAQAIIDAENARIAAANKAAADKLAAERAEFEKAQEAERKTKAEEEARRAEQARIAALVRPSDDEMIDVLAIHYNAPAERVVDWILTMDLSSRAAA